MTPMPTSAPPVARTPLHAWHAARGAHFAERGGWQVVTHYAGAEAEVEATRTGLGVADGSAAAKFAVQGPGVPALAAQLVPDGSASTAHGVGRLSDDGPALVCRLEEDHLLVLATSAESGNLGGRLADLCREPPLVLTDMTSALAGLVVLGPGLDALLRRLTHLDLRPASFPANSCAETALAGVEALLVRPAGSPLPALHIFVAWDMAEFVWERILEAGHAGKIAPVGLDALTRIG